LLRNDEISCVETDTRSMMSSIDTTSVWEVRSRLSVLRCMSTSWCGLSRFSKVCPGPETFFVGTVVAIIAITVKQRGNGKMNVGVWRRALLNERRVALPLADSQTPRRCCFRYFQSYVQGVFLNSLTVKFSYILHNMLLNFSIPHRYYCRPS
jgi:hypothetical protein